MYELFDGRYKDRTNFTSNEYLHINSCGVSRLTFAGKPRSMRIYRPDGRVDFHILLVTDSEVIAQIRGKEYVLHKGDCMFYAPHEPQEYTYSVDASASVSAALYVHFCGTSANEIMQKAGLSESGPIFGTSAEAKRIFGAMIRSFHANDELTAHGDLLRLISFLSPKSALHKSDSAGLVLTQAEYINSHYTEEIDLKECAAQCNLSLSRFTHLFAEIMGMAPHRYQQRLRLEQACELLLYSTQAVSEIAESVGFSDSLYFSRLFRKTFGTSPSQYRHK